MATPSLIWGRAQRTSVRLPHAEVRPTRAAKMEACPFAQRCSYIDTRFGMAILSGVPRLDSAVHHGSAKDSPHEIDNRSYPAAVPGQHPPGPRCVRACTSMIRQRQRHRYTTDTSHPPIRKGGRIHGGARRRWCALAIMVGSWRHPDDPSSEYRANLLSGYIELAESALPANGILCAHGISGNMAPCFWLPEVANHPG